MKTQDITYNEILTSIVLDKRFEQIENLTHDNRKRLIKHVIKLMKRLENYNKEFEEFLDHWQHCIKWEIEILLAEQEELDERGDL